MAPPFVALTIPEFESLFKEWAKQARRRIEAVHMHHTWRPNHAQYRGHETIVGMWRTHTQVNGWSDIAQHVSIAPDGLIWTGRHWDLPPASSSGYNGKPGHGPFMFEMIGDFDVGRDTFQDPQREAALWVSAIVLRTFGLGTEALKFHRELHSPKTCPGTAINHAEIAAAVGALLDKPVPAATRSLAAVGSFDAVGEARKSLAGAPPLRGDDGPDAELAETSGEPFDPVMPSAAPGARATARAVELSAATLDGLRPHLINFQGGLCSTTGYKTTPADIRDIFAVHLPTRLAALPAGAKLPVVFYAHGGLVKEKEGLQIAATQIPWWNANGVYPIQFVWETGLFEELGRIIGISREAPRGLFDDAKDRAIELAVGGIGTRLWNAMKHDASRTFEPGGGGELVIAGLKALLAAHPGKVSLHLIGHSAGSIFHSYFVPALAAALPKTKLASLSLLAPAVNVADYKTRLDPLIGKTIDTVTMFTMAKDYELKDTVASIYGKSLLYLVSNAFETKRHEPILGLDESLRDDDALRRRFGLDGALGTGEVIFSKSAASYGRSATQSTTHGGFDNDAPTMESVLRRILGLDGETPLKARFPVDPIARSVDLPDQRDAPAAVVAGSAAVASPASGARRALCIGIDEYPDPRSRLSGCVADAEAWAAALAAHDFVVEKLHNAVASRANILARLQVLLTSAAPGDSLVLQFAGHGTQVADFDGDEDDNMDEAFCPVDYDQGRLIIDDDLRTAFAALPPGATLTCFFDSCHSGTITRMAMGQMDIPPGSRPRYIVLDQATADRHRAFRATQGSRAVPVADRNAMREVVFSACKPEEVALESAGRGAFSVRAVPVLAEAAVLSNGDFAARVTAAFGDGPRQHPNLDCADGATAAPLFGGAASVAAAGAAVPGGGAGGGGSVNLAVAEILLSAARLLARQG